jgi:hypothetical protein
MSPNHDPHRIVQLCDEPIKILSVNKLTMKLSPNHDPNRIVQLCECIFVALDNLL